MLRRLSIFTFAFLLFALAFSLPRPAAPPNDGLRIVSALLAPSVAIAQPHIAAGAVFSVIVAVAAWLVSRHTLFVTPPNDQGSTDRSSGRARSSGSPNKRAT